ncbi:hypothetical protein [Rhodococcus sp. NPDC060176]|uniref:hypothetical protein n=1 Tax=Rhodococcus sp. NPDC060176 TaxID=3347062 RepID=UPI0036647D26
MWDQLASVAADPSVTVLAQTSDGWGGLQGMLDSVQDNMMELGLTILGILGIIIAIKVGGAGKGKMRESVESIGIWGLAGLVIGLALFVPGVLSKVGRDVGSSTGGGNVSVVDGQ